MIRPTLFPNKSLSLSLSRPPFDDLLTLLAVEPLASLIRLSIISSLQRRRRKVYSKLTQEEEGVFKADAVNEGTLGKRKEDERGKRRMRRRKRREEEEEKGG